MLTHATHNSVSETKGLKSQLLFATTSFEFGPLMTKPASPVLLVMLPSKLILWKVEDGAPKKKYPMGCFRIKRGSQESDVHMVKLVESGESS